MQKHFWLGCLATLFITFSAPLLAATDSTAMPQQKTLAEIKGLLAAHKTQEAYAIANQMASSQEGNLDFDLLFATAALEANHPDVAVFALERVLIRQPNNQSVKEQLGRAYYLSSDYLSAKPLLTDISRSQTAPEALRTEARNLLMEMRNPTKNKAQAKVSNRFSAQILGGHDSNINSATTADTITFPSTPTTPVTLSGNSLGIRDTFSEVTAAWRDTCSFSPHAGLFWDVGGSYRDNVHNKTFNLNTFNGAGGFIFQEGAYTLQIPLRAQAMYLDGNRLRRAFATALNFSRPITEQHTGMLFAEKGTQTYPLQDILNMTTNIGGAAWLYAPNNQTQVITRAYYGVNEARLDLPIAKAQGSHYYGAQFSLSEQVFEKGTASLNLAQQYSTFNLVDPTFLVLRRDNFFNASLQYEWKYNSALSLVGNYTHYRNDSDLPVYEYKRNIAQLGLKYNV